LSEPSYAIWLITSRCNLNCKHCYVKGRPLGNELSTKEAFKLVSILADLGIEWVNITGGEPLLRKDLFQIIDKFREYGIEATIFSNLTIANEELIEEIRKREIYVYTSIDGSASEIHDYIRGKGAWEKTIKAIKELGGENVATTFTITRYNYFDAGNYVRLAYNLGIEYISLIPVIPSTNRAREAMPTLEQLWEGVKEASKAATEFGIKVSIWCTPTLALKPLKGIRVGGCPTNSVIDIGPDGRVLICDTLDYSVGNILKESPRKILERYVHNRIEESLKMPLECLNCPICMNRGKR